ncbi:hypothetical protein [Nocardia sp. NPDC057353]|uniref:hypothetical protein n=1 Tax=Nocardia sp. NPDC057353 TaxID=3346104 RepID=UPI00362F8F05
MVRDVGTIRFDLEVEFRAPRRIRHGVPPLNARGRIVPRLDGVRFTDLVDRFEQQAGMEPAGEAYGGIVPALLRFDGGSADRHFLGHEPRTRVLACRCGEWADWPLILTITTTDTTVNWSDAEQPFRPARDYTAFGPFRFPRPAYDRALADLSAALAATVAFDRETRAALRR